MPNQNNKVAAIDLVRKDPQLAAVLSKVVSPVNPIDRQTSENKYNHIYNTGQITHLSDAMKQKTENNRNILQLFPDLELAAQIVVSSVLSPKDMVFESLIYKCEDQSYPPELVSKLIQKSKETFEDIYGFDKEVSDILRSVLFKNGSEIKAVIPENVLDDIINGKSVIATESMYDPSFRQNLIKDVFGEGGISSPDYLGFLGDKPDVNERRSSLESLGITNRKAAKKVGLYDPKENTLFTDVIDICDNFNLLKLPEVTSSFRQKAIQNLFKSNHSLESGKLTNNKLQQLLYKDPKRSHSEVLIVPDSSNATRRFVGRPLCMKLPTEAVVPVFTPGNEKKHVGYFILIDMDGNPVSKLSVYDRGANLRSLFEKGDSKDEVSNSILSRVKKNMGVDVGTLTIDHIDKVFSNILEQNMLSKLSSGMYSGELEFGMTQDITATMLFRTLAGKFTRLLFLPKEMVSYFALKFNDNGTGRSYLDDVSFLTSLRAVILLSKVIGLTKNAIPITHVNMTLDPRDHDPERTIQEAVHEITKTRTGNFPIGTNAPLEILDYIQRAGLEITFEGHPGIPSTKLEFENKRMDHAIPDTELDDQLKKQTYMGFGVNPEMVDNGYSAEFAASVTANNVLMAKNTSVIQDGYSECITEHYKRVLGFDQIFLGEARDVIEQNIALVENTMTDDEKKLYSTNKEIFIDAYLERFLSSIKVGFPKPDQNSLTTLSEKFDEYKEAIEKSIEYIVSSQTIPQEFAGEISGNIEVVKGLWISHLMRKWMADNNFVPEAMGLTEMGDDGDPKNNLNEITVMHLKAVMKSAISLLRSMDSVKKVADADLQNIGTEPSSVSPAPEPSPDTSGGDEGIGDDTGGEGGGDDMGLGEFK